MSTWALLTLPGKFPIGGLAVIVWLLPVLATPSGDLRHKNSGHVRSAWRGRPEPAGPVLNNTHANITAQLGGSAYLHCLVGHLGERRQISWIRKRDWHILSSGKNTYTNDERFQVLHGESTEEWALHIKFVQKRDNGTYECQVSTRTGVLSHYVHLQIVVPEAFILGSDELHVDLGSVINLICIVDKSPTPPQYVFWYHNERMINYDATRGGISVDTRPGERSESRLTVRGATVADSGNYTCSASNTQPASIHVFVSEGSNKMAAILKRNTSPIHDITSSTTLLLLLLNVATCYVLR